MCRSPGGFYLSFIVDIYIALVKLMTITV